MRAREGDRGRFGILLFNDAVIKIIPGADKSLARPGRKQARKHVRPRAILTTPRRELSSSFFFLQGKASKEIHAILTETLACFLPGRDKDFSASLYSVASR